MDLCRDAGDDFWTAAGLNLLSEIAVHTGRPDQAEEFGREAAWIAEAAGDRWNEGWALGIRAAVAGLRGRMREAAELASASVDVMRAIDHRWGVARAQLGLGDLARVRGDFADARQQYMEALAYLREINARPEIARCLSGLGRVATEAGATTLAREHLTESLRLSRDTGTRIGVARGLESFAALAVREDEPERAVLLAAAATALRETAGLPPLSGARAERYLAPARRLGDAAVAELWARGLELSPAAAIAVALEPPAAPATPAESRGCGARSDGRGHGLAAERADAQGTADRQAGRRRPQQQGHRRRACHQPGDRGQAHRQHHGQAGLPVACPDRGLDRRPPVTGSAPPGRGPLPRSAPPPGRPRAARQESACR